VGELHGRIDWPRVSGRGTIIRSVFTDLRHHDLGPNFYEYSYANNRLRAIKRFRTAPLWGVGSSAPYGTRGRSLTLDHVIRMHGGEAEPVTRRYIRASAAEQHALVTFLESLVLYDPARIAIDLDGNGVIADYWRDGMDLGPELFRPELLFTVAPHYEGWKEDHGWPYFSYALHNYSEAYQTGAFKPISP
jgi:hypothetical protein